jgi:hypothetical protein
MKSILKLFMVLVLTLQTSFVYASDGEENGEDYNPPIETPENIFRKPVCDDCIPFDSVKGQVVEINGTNWRLDQQLPSGDWLMDQVEDHKSLTYTGRSADETFGTESFSVPNSERVRWMNAGFAALDRAMANSDYSPSKNEKIRAKVFKGMNDESIAVIKAIDETLKVKSGNKNSVICPDFTCYSNFDSMNDKSSTKIVIGQTPDQFMSDLYNNLPDTDPAVADQVGQSGQYLDTKPYLSSHQEALDKERDRLIDARAQGPHQWDAKVAAFLNQRKADNAYLANDNQAGDDHFKVAHFLADVATDIIPFTAIPKDIFKALVGKDPLTGQDLSPMERVLAAGFAGLNTFSLGGAGILAAGIKNVGRAAGATLKEIALAEKLTEVIAKSPLRVEVLVKGASEEFTFIGRDMTRVNEVSAALEKSGIKVNTLNEFTDAANKQWEKLLTTYKARGLRIPDVEVIKSLKYVENETWIKSALEKGHTILDLGDPAGNVFSPFYNMEKKEILNYLRKVKK